MFYKIVFAFAFLTVLVDSKPRTPFKELVSVIELEEACVRQGGLCLRIEDCDPGNLVSLQGVLCPRQSGQGVECCYS